ncbi:MAG: 4,5-DOPA dioxygenase extradiol [Vulcanimicrobiaceae bacterium]
MISSPAPLAFFGHGTPLNALRRNRHTEAWERFGRSIPKPRAVLAISAHWYVPGTRVLAQARPPTIHDFNRGFPRELFEFDYPAAGDSPLAERIRALLAPLDVPLDRSWGIDHGAWSVLAHLFPDAGVPVVELSIDRTEPPAFHYKIAQKLAPLRDEGVFVFASGNVVHNLELCDRETTAKAFDWAQRYEERVCALLAEPEHGPLIAYARDGDDARLSIPTPDHYLPMLYALALQRSDERPSILTRGVENGALSMLSFAFEP